MQFITPCCSAPPYPGREFRPCSRPSVIYCPLPPRPRHACAGGSSPSSGPPATKSHLFAPTAASSGPGSASRCHAVFAPTEIIHLERPIGVGTAFEPIGHGFFGTLGLRVEPAPPGTGLTYRLEVELGSLPQAFHKAIKETVARTLEQGVYGWPVTDVVVTLTHSGYWSPITTAGHFRVLTPLVLAGALAMARTRVSNRATGSTSKCRWIGSARSSLTWHRRAPGSRRASRRRSPGR